MSCVPFSVSLYLLHTWLDALITFLFTSLSLSDSPVAFSPDPNIPSSSPLSTAGALFPPALHCAQVGVR